MLILTVIYYDEIGIINFSVTKNIYSNNNIIILSNAFGYVEKVCICEGVF